MINTNYKTFFLFLISILCVNFYAYAKIDYEKISDRLVAQYAKQMYLEENIRLVGYGGSMMYNVKEISLTFECYKTLSVAEARQLYVKIMEGFLEKINQNELIRPYLDNYPFVWSNIGLRLMFKDRCSKNFPEGYVALMFQGREGTVVYRGHENDKFYLLHRETPEEALKAAGWCQ